jgi:hypothetical protein
MIGISTGLVAFWSAYRVFWSLYLTISYDFLFGSLVFQIALWGVIGVAAGVASAAFVTRYLELSKATEPQRD